MGKCGRRSYCYLHPHAWVKSDTFFYSHSPPHLLSPFLLALPRGSPVSHSFDCPTWWMCSVRNGPSQGPWRRFWVKQHPISNPSIPSQAGNLFTGAGKHRNPFLVRVSRGCNKNLDRRSFGECCKTEAVINMYCGLGSFEALGTTHKFTRSLLTLFYLTSNE